MKTQDILSAITQEIIAELERGVMPWSQPWGDGMPPVMPRRHSDQRYRGVNILILWSKAHARGYKSAYWMTFQQALQYKACVRKGERGTQIVFANRVNRTEQDEHGDDVDRSFSFLKSYTVFNAEQIDGLPAKFAPPAAPPSVIAEAIDWTAYTTQAAWFENIPASVAHDGGHRAYYMPSEDRIRLPAQAEFRSAEGYFCTRAHETVHWTKHEHRLARDFAAKRFGDEGYAMEELTAELGAAFCMAEIGLAPAIREDHAPYIANWLKALKNDAKALLTAASKASDALEYLCQFQPVDETHDPEANFKDAA
jgi:antirestriction protein ArdC